MKIALLGNCQLQQIGWLLKNFFAQHGIDHSVVWYEPIFALGDKNAAIVPLFDALASADAIYGQYHDGKWNAFSTENLSKFFEIKIVPTLESLASFPQMNYFSAGSLNFNLYTVDFRILDLYLQGVDVHQAPALYANAGLDAGRKGALIHSTAVKYKKLYDDGKTLFDYAGPYLEAMGTPSPYFVHNHPNNAQLQWLANQILLDCKSPTLVSLENLPQILTDTIVPELDAPLDERYKLRNTEIGIRTACKVYYAFFSTYDTDFLQRELDQSTYRSLVSRAG